jgi:ethanolamine-phosphate cytidylyltransferase
MEAAASSSSSSSSMTSSLLLSSSSASASTQLSELTQLFVDGLTSIDSIIESKFHSQSDCISGSGSGSGSDSGSGSGSGSASSDLSGVSVTLRLQALAAAVQQKYQAHLTITTDPSPASSTSDCSNTTDTTNTNRRVVRGYVDGCFDIMHSGHYNALRQAKMLCDVLVVGVHSDEEILRNKGPPVMNNEERMATVKACKWADEVVFDTPYDPSVELLKKLNCDFAIHGDDMSTTADGTDAFAAVRNAGMLRTIKRTAGVSTTDLVGRLLLMTKTHHDHDIKSINESSNTDSDCDSHYAAGVSSFLPTTWRISQFSNGRTPSAHDKVIYIDGAFDLFHIGHIETLKQARELGTFMYVGIHDDQTVNKYRGSNYPIMNLHERIMNVLSCTCVDEVIIGAPWIVPKDLIKVLGVDVVVSGAIGAQRKRESDAHIDPYAVPKELGIFEQVPTHHLLSTDDVVKRIIHNRTTYQKRNAKRSVKELDYLESREYVQEI